MASPKVTLKSVPQLLRDETTHHVRVRQTLDSMADELAELRKLPDQMASKDARIAMLESQVEGLKAMLATFKAIFERPAVPFPTPQIGTGEQSRAQ